MPVQKNPRLWIAGFSKVAVKRAARVGAGYIAVGPIGPFTHLDPSWSDEHIELMGKEVIPAFR